MKPQATVPHRFKTNIMHFAALCSQVTRISYWLLLQVCTTQEKMQAQASAATAVVKTIEIDELHYNDNCAQCSACMSASNFQINNLAFQIFTRTQKFLDHFEHSEPSINELPDIEFVIQNRTSNLAKLPKKTSNFAPP